MFTKDPAGHSLCLCLRGLHKGLTNHVVSPNSPPIHSLLLLLFLIWLSTKFKFTYTVALTLQSFPELLKNESEFTMSHHFQPQSHCIVLYFPTMSPSFLFLQEYFCADPDSAVPLKSPYQLFSNKDLLASYCLFLRCKLIFSLCFLYFFESKFFF